MYFIEDGTVSIKIQQDKGETEISKLEKGQYFGNLIETQGCGLIWGLTAFVWAQNILLTHQSSRNESPTRSLIIGFI